LIINYEIITSLIVDLDTKKPIKILRSALRSSASLSRRSEELRKVFEGWGYAVLEQIQEVSIDLWAPYKKLVEELMPTSGVVEGINNKLKLIKRLGYGFRNFENFKLRTLLTWHFGINYP
jgi:transposase